MAISARIEELERKFNENPRRYFAPLANEYRKAGDVAHAVELCRAYLPQQPGHMSGHIVFGQALFESGELDEAQKVFETALSLDPENLIALKHLGDIARARGDITAARSWYQRVLDADPRNDEIADQLRALSAMPQAAPPATPEPPAEPAVAWSDIPPGAGRQPAPSATAELEDLKVELEAAAATGSGPLAEVERSSQVDTARTVGSGSAPPPTREPPGREAATAQRQHAERPVDRKETPRERPGQEAAPPPPAPAVPVGKEPAARDSVTREPAAAAPSPDERSAGAVAAAKEPATASPPAPAISAAEALGLETMEFAPPSRSEQAPPAQGLETGHESITGGSPPPSPATPGSSDAATPPGFVTETMAELYLQQGFTQEALGVYRQLLAQNPNDQGLRERIDQLERGAPSSVSAAAISDDVIEGARRRASAPRRHTMRAFLGGLAARRAPAREQAPYGYGAEPAAPYEPSQVGRADRLEDESAPAPRSRHADDNRWSARGSQSDAGASAPAVARDSLDALFEGAAVAGEDEEAAAMLSGAFPAVESPDEAGISGRPTREAATELSLDHVFRESTPRGGGGRQRSDFSFDQFFSESASGDESADADQAPAPQSADDAPSPDDIEQFNSWLEALKKK